MPSHLVIPSLCLEKVKLVTVHVSLLRKHQELSRVYVLNLNVDLFLRLVRVNTILTDAGQQQMELPVRSEIRE